MPSFSSSPVPPGFVRARPNSRFFRSLGRYYMLERPDAPPVYGIHARPKHGNRHGTGHGGFLATLADTFMAGYASHAFPGERIVTAELRIRYVRPARIGSWLQSRCVSIERKADIVLVQCDVEADGAPVIRAYGRFKLLPPLT